MKNLVLIAFLALGAAVWVHHSQAPLQAEDLENANTVWVLDQFRSQVNQVNRLTIQKGQDTWHLQRLESGWVSEDQADYPLEFQKVREFLFSLSGLQNPQAKTSQPKRWADLQLDPAGEAKPTGRVQAWVDDATVLDLWVGKSRWQPEPGVYLRHEGQDQTWLAQGRLQFPWQLSSWMDTKVISLAAAHVDSIAIRGNLELDLGQDGAEEDKSFANLSSALSFLSFETAVAITHQDFSRPPLRTLTWTTTDGGQVALAIFTSKDGHVAKIALTPSIIPSVEEAPGDTETAVETPEDPPAKPQVEADPRWQTWGFSLPAQSAAKLLEGPTDWLAPEED